MCTAPSHLCDGCLQLYTPSRTLRSAFDILSFQSFLLPDFPLLVPAPLPSSAPLLTWNDLPLTLHLANVYCTVRLCVFCKWSEIFGGVIWWTNVGLLCVVSDGPANDCCTVCVLQTVQLVILYCVLQTARSTGHLSFSFFFFADGAANVVLCVLQTARSTGHFSFSFFFFADGAANVVLCVLQTARSTGRTWKAGSV